MIFDPNAGSGSAVLVASSSDNGYWERPDYAEVRREYENSQREREYGSLMRERASVCG